MKWMNLLKGLLYKKSNQTQVKVDYSQYEKIKISTSLKENINYLKHELANSQDIIYRNFSVGSVENHMTLVYIPGLVDEEKIDNNVLKPLRETFNSNNTNNQEEISIEKIKKRLTTSGVNTTYSFGQAIASLLKGDTLLFLEGASEILLVGSRGGEKRGVEEPSVDQAMRGPKDGFVENIIDNIALIRRRICDPNLSVEYLEKGERTKTKIALIYLKDVMNDEIIQEIRESLKKIKTEALVSSSQVEHLIEGHQWSIFPQILSTERPDKVAGSILEGRAAIVIEGTPFTLIAPVTFASFMVSADDYYQRALITSLIRLLRYISYFLASTMPALYIAITAYHPGMLPTNLVLYITGTRVGLPFPSLVEVFFMEFALMALVEASVRLPKPIGQTIGIVGGLVIGQAAVQAGLVSPLVIIIVSFTAINSFVLPNYTFASSSRMLRVPLIIGASFLGLYGIVAIWLLMIIHMASLENFKVRYLADFSPFNLHKLRDSLIKVPDTILENSPEYLMTKKKRNEEINR